MELCMQLTQALALVRDIPDFPHPGILFKDITPILSDAHAFGAITTELAGEPSSYSHVVGVEARGFILGAAISAATMRGFVPFRKAGKLPHTTISRSYGLEYGQDILEAHSDALVRTDRVLIVDDVLATGGTLIAAIEMVLELGASICEVVVLIEIEALGGRLRIAEKFPEISVRTVVTI